MSNTRKDTTPPVHNGYIEGYYGRLLSWQERSQMLETLSDLGMSTYLYAPKEDPCHRLDWRQPWGRDWEAGFSELARQAQDLGLHLMAGVAPGLDFDFGSFTGTGNDMEILCRKTHRLKTLGASSVMLLMDDIDADFSERSGHFSTEGEAHAALANAISSRIGEPVSLTPRVYADEIQDKAEGYLETMLKTLDPRHLITWCGAYIVDPEPGLETSALGRFELPPERVIFRDNLYANDYCPRQLWLGPWQGRDNIRQIMLHPTGLPYTDRLLLSVMAAGPDRQRWASTLRDHGVPEEFHLLASFFDLPPDLRKPIDETPFDQGRIPAWLDALDRLLWKWKSPLAREWYPYLMALRGDLLRLDGQMNELRIRKTYPPALEATIRSGKR